MALKDNARCLPIARTGRVQDWLDDPSGRLPVSCTTFVVQDSMEGEDGIEASWRFVSHALRNGAGVSVHLSHLRPAGVDNGKGLVSSGPVSFGTIYSRLNEVLRRGGKFKNGAVVLHLDYDHPDAIAFISAPRIALPWAKRCLNVDDHFLTKASPELIAAIIKGITNGDLWLMKMKTDENGARIYGNVCVAKGTLIDTKEGPTPIEDLAGKPFVAIVTGEEYESSPRGAWSNGVKKVVKVFFENGKTLVATPTHEVVLLTGDGKRAQKQPIALLKYGDKVATNDDDNYTFTGTFSRVVDIVDAGEKEVYDCSIPSLGFFSANGLIVSNCLEVLLPHRGTCLLQHVNLGAFLLSDPAAIVQAFKDGMTELCQLHGRTGVGNTGEYLPPSVDRQVGLGLLGLANFLAINGITYAQLADALDGNDTIAEAKEAVNLLKQGISDAAEIARQYEMERAFAIAPTASCSYRHLDTRGFTTAPEIAPPISQAVDRDSSTFDVEPFDYGPVETAAEVGWEVYKRVANGIVRMFQATGLFHGYSYNWWSDVVQCDEAFLRDWLASPQTSLYYALPVMPNVQAKDDAYVSLDDEFKTLLGLDTEETKQRCIPCSE